MENIHEALSHSHSQSSAQSHFCSISFLWLSHMKDTTFKEDTMADCSRLIPDIRRHSEYMLCTNTLKICTTQSPLSTNRSQWPSLSYLEWFAISQKWFACFEICERAIVYINLRRSEQQRRETAFGKNVDYDLSQIRTNLRIPQDYHEIHINHFLFNPMTQTETAKKI